MAGTTQRLFASPGSDGIDTDLLVAEATLVAGTQTVANIPDEYTPIGLVRVAAGAGALGNLTASVAADTLTILSDAATDVSSVRVLLARGIAL